MTESEAAALERVAATRYVTPLREGGSLPGLVEADDDGIYVLKFRGAGQGVKVLVAEILVTELARAARDPGAPARRSSTLDAQIAKYEADEEVQDLLNASIGLNLGVDFLPGSFGYDGSVPPPEDVAAAHRLAGCAHRQRRPHLEQPEPAALAPPHVGDRPRRRALLPPRLAEPRTRPGPVRRAALRRLHPRAARGRGGPARRCTRELAADPDPRAAGVGRRAGARRVAGDDALAPRRHRGAVGLPRDAPRPAGQPGRAGSRRSAT